jgi:hypothetical protein
MPVVKKRPARTCYESLLRVLWLRLLLGLRLFLLFRLCLAFWSRLGLSSMNLRLRMLSLGSFVMLRLRMGRRWMRRLRPRRLHVLGSGSRRFRPLRCIVCGSGCALFGTVRRMVIARRDISRSALLNRWATRLLRFGAYWLPLLNCRMTRLALLDRWATRLALLDRWTTRLALLNRWATRLLRLGATHLLWCGATWQRNRTTRLS